MDRVQDGIRRPNGENRDREAQDECGLMGIGKKRSGYRLCYGYVSR